MSAENLKIAEEYLEAMNNRNLGALAKHLHAQLNFKSPLANSNDLEGFLEITKKLFTLLKRVEMKAKFEAHNQTLLVYDMVFPEPLGHARAFNWMAFEPPESLRAGEWGKIKAIEVLYDPRPFEKFFASQAAQSPHPLQKTSGISPP
jgi:hypothetical protein